MTWYTSICYNILYMYTRAIVWGKNMLHQVYQEHLRYTCTCAYAIPVFTH